MIPASIHNLLGLAQRAKGVAAGGAYAEEAIRRGKAALVIIAADAGSNTRSNFLFLAREQQIPAYQLGSQEALGQAIGLSPRAVVVVTSRDLARGLIPLLAPFAVGP